MKRLSEKVVQKKAIEFLRLRYLKQTLPNTKLTRNPEEYTNKKKRADGMFCLHTKRQRFFVASLEAKSHKTLHNLSPKWNDGKVFQNGSAIALVLIILFLLIASSLSSLWLIIGSLLIGLFSLLGYFFYSESFAPTSHKLSEVFQQIDKYPGNEQWLAVSDDSLILLNMQSNFFKGQSNDEAIKEICIKRGVGLLVVTPKAVKVELKPKYKKGFFLPSYRYHNEIKAAMDEFEEKYAT